MHHPPTPAIVGRSSVASSKSARNNAKLLALKREALGKELEMSKLDIEICQAEIAAEEEERMSDRRSSMSMRPKARSVKMQPAVNQEVDKDSEVRDWLKGGTDHHRPVRLNANYKPREPVTAQHESHDRDPVLEAMEKMASTIRQGFSLPKVELETFNGNPIHYYEFITNFDCNIDREISNPSVKLSYLISLCSKEAKDAIKSCVLIDPPSEGYHEARKILHDKYGQRYVIADAYQKQLLDGPQLRANDHDGLCKLATLMRNCEMTFQQWDISMNMDNHDNLAKLFRRFPKHLQTQLHQQVSSNMVYNGMPTFHDIVEFIELKVKMGNTLFGKIINESSRPVRSHEVNKSKRSSFATVSAAESRSTTEIKAGQDEPPYQGARSCEYCKQDHIVYKCQQFKNLSVDERMTFVKRQRLCFNCLHAKHSANHCRSKNSCFHCSKRHHTLLHFNLPRVTQSVEDQNPVELIIVLWCHLVR